MNDGGVGPVRFQCPRYSTRRGAVDEVGHARSPRLKPIAVHSLIFSATGPKRADYPHLARLGPSNPAPSIRTVQEPRTRETLNSKVKPPIGPLTRHYEWATVPFQSSTLHSKGTGKPFIRLSVIHRSPAPGETAMHKVERLALREEGKEACAREEGGGGGGTETTRRAPFTPHDPSFTPLPFTPLVHKLSSSSS